MSTNTNKDTKDEAQVSVTVRSEAAAIGEPSPVETITSALPTTVEGAKEYAHSALSSVATLPSTATLAGSLQSARESVLLETAKSTSLSTTGQRAVAEAEALLDASQKLVEKAAPHDEVQTLITEGAAAAAAIQAAVSQHSDVVGVFGSESERQQVAHAAEDSMRRAFEVTRAIVGQKDVRSTLAEAAELAAQWVSAVSLASVHHAVAGVSDRGKQVIQDVAAVAGETAHVEVGDKDLTDQDAAEKAAAKELDEARDAREKLAATLAQLTEQYRTLALQLKDNPSLRAVVSDLLHLFRSVTQRAWSNVKTSTTTSAEQDTLATALDTPQVCEHAEKAKDAAKQLIANFGGDLAPLQMAVQHLATVAGETQPQVTGLMDAADAWLRDAESVADEAKARAVYEQWQAVLAETYERAGEVKAAVSAEDEGKSKGELRDAVAKLLTESRAFITSLKHDETATAVQDHLANLTNALFVDEQTGLATVKPELLDDLRRMIPALVQSLATLPVARIDVESNEADVILDNLTLAAEVLPKDLRVDTSTQITLDTGKSITTVYIHLRNVAVHIPDLVFWYSKKTFPQLVDVGIADVTIPRLDIDLTTQPSMQPNKLLTVLESKAVVHDLALDVKKARHNWMYTLLSPWVRRQLSSRIETAVQDALKSGIETLERAAKRAAESVQYAPTALAQLRESIPAMPSFAAATTSAAQPAKDEKESGGILETVSKKVSDVIGTLGSATQQGAVEKEQ